MQCVFCKISDSHSSGTRDSVHLGSYALSSGIFRRFGEYFYLHLKGPCSLEIFYCFETSVNIYQSTRRNILQDMKFSGYGLYG